MEELDCSENNLSSLIVPDNMTLGAIDCSENNLSSLILFKNMSLKKLYCFGNKISGEAMTAFLNSLREVTTDENDFGGCVVVDNQHSEERNICTKEQVAIAKAKGWKVYDNNRNSPKEYNGSEHPSQLIP